MNPLIITIQRILSKSLMMILLLIKVSIKLIPMMTSLQESAINFHHPCMHNQAPFDQESSSASYPSNPKYISSGHPYDTFDKGNPYHHPYISQHSSLCDTLIAPTSHPNPLSHYKLIYKPNHQSNPTISKSSFSNFLQGLLEKDIKQN